MSCRQDQIKNPLTNRCVLISGAVGKNLIELHKQNQVALDLTNVEKIRHILDPKLNKHTEHQKQNNTSQDTNHNLKTNREQQKKNREQIPGQQKSNVIPVLAFRHFKKGGKMVNNFNYICLDGPLLTSQEIIKTSKITDVDYEWIQSQNDYMATLTKSDLYTIYGYTYHGDKFANNLLRGSFKKADFQKYLLDRFENVWRIAYFPFFFQCMRFIEGGNAPVPYNDILMSDAKLSDKYLELSKISPSFSIEDFWVPVIHMFIADLNRIIQASPPLKNKMTVYRGVRSKHVVNGDVFQNKAFISTSMALRVAKDYATKSCCLKRISLPVGTHVLLIAGVTMFPKEIEVLIGSSSKFKVKQHAARKRSLQIYNLNMMTQ